MTTTYEIYTNDGGTPKAVTGNAPAIVERVENLETAVEAVETSVNDKLPLSGGTLTGQIAFGGTAQQVICRTDSSTGLVVRGGTTYNDGSSLILSGKTDGNPTQFDLLTRNADGGAVALTAKGDGSLSWGGKDVITSAGGTFTGTDIKFSTAGTIASGSSSQQLTLRNGGSANQGAGIWLYGNDNDGAGKARIQVYDKTNSQYRVFDIKPDGSLTWENKNIVRSVNGTSADTSGNVTISAGGGSASRGTVVNISSVKTYTAPSNGIIYVEADIGSSGGYDQLYIYTYIGSTYIGNSKATRTRYTADAGSDEPLPYYMASRAFFVNKGDVVTCKSKQNTSSSYNLYFTGCFTPVNIG